MLYITSHDLLFPGSHLSPSATSPILVSSTMSVGRMPKPQPLFGGQTASWISALEHLPEILPFAQYVFTEHLPYGEQSRHSSCPKGSSSPSSPQNPQWLEAWSHPGCFPPFTPPISHHPFYHFTRTSVPRTWPGSRYRAGSHKYTMNKWINMLRIHLCFFHSCHPSSRGHDLTGRLLQAPLMSVPSPACPPTSSQQNHSLHQLGWSF